MKDERNWDTLYVATDLHSTIIKPYYNDTIEFYPDSIEVIKWFNSRLDFQVILWTSSYEPEITVFLIEAYKKGIRFDFVNSNPLEQNSKKGCFTRKFYFNILLEDRAGFVGETDWTLIKNELIRLGEWSRTSVKP
jgi:phosphoserine phosphatase